METQKVIIYPRLCKRCDICIAFCHRNALEKGEDGYPRLVRNELCNSCGLCEVLCPDFAISVVGRHRG